MHIVEESIESELQKQREEEKGELEGGQNQEPVAFEQSVNLVVGCHSSSASLQSTEQEHFF